MFSEEGLYVHKQVFNVMFPELRHLQHQKAPRISTLKFLIYGAPALQSGHFLGWISIFTFLKFAQRIKLVKIFYVLIRAICVVPEF